MNSKKSFKILLIATAIVLSVIIGTVAMISMALPSEPNGDCPFGWYPEFEDSVIPDWGDDDEPNYSPPDIDGKPDDVVFGERWFTPLTNSNGWLGEGFNVEWGVPLDNTTASHIFGENGLKMWVHAKSFNYYPSLFHAICCREKVYVDWNEPVTFHIDTTQASDHITAWVEAVFDIECLQLGYTKVNFDQVMAHITDNGLDSRMSPLRPNQGYYKGSITLRDALRFIIDESAGDEIPEVRNRRDAAAIYNAFLANNGVLRLVQTRVYIFAPDFVNDPDFDNAPHFAVWPTYFHQDNFALIHEFSFGRAPAPANSETLRWCWHCQ